MADNINIGNGDDITLGLNLELGAEKAESQLNTLLSILKQMSESETARLEATTTSTEKVVEQTTQKEEQLRLEEEMESVHTRIQGILERNKSLAGDTLYNLTEITNVLNRMQLTGNRTGLDQVLGTLGNAGSSGQLDLSSLKALSGLGMSGAAYAGPEMPYVNQALGRTSGLGSGSYKSSQSSGAGLIDKYGMPLIYAMGGGSGGRNTGNDGTGFDEGPEGEDYGQVPPMMGGSPEADELDMSLGSPQVKTGRRSYANPDNLIRTALYRSNLGRMIVRMARNTPISQFLGNTKIGNTLGQYLYGVGSTMNKGIVEGEWGWMGPGGKGFDPTALGNPWEGDALLTTLGGLGGVATLGMGLGVAGRAIGQGYDIYAGLQRQGQLYTGLTGGTGDIGALGYNIRAGATSLFGLNPLESYGQAKQIEMNALGQGYKGNLLNQAIGFGNFAQTAYNIDPNTSAEMFSQAVVKMGMSAGELQSALTNLAQTASTTNTSFQGLQQSYMQGLNAASAVGVGGNQASFMAQNFATQFANIPSLAGTDTNATPLTTMLGQAFAAQQLGVGIQQVYAYGAGDLGVSKTLAAANLDIAGGNDIRRILAMAGLKKGASDKEIDLAHFKLSYLLPNIGIDISSWQPPQYRKWVRQYLDQGDVKGLNTNTIKEAARNAGITNSEISAYGDLSKPQNLQNFEQGMASMLSGNDPNHSGQTMLGHDLSRIGTSNHWNNAGIDLNGHFISQSDYNKLSHNGQMLLNALLLSNKASIANADAKGNIIAGGNLDRNGLLAMLGHKGTQDLINQYGSGAQLLHNVQISFSGPMAQFLQAYIKNPGEVTSTQIQQFLKTTGRA